MYCSICVAEAQVLCFGVGVSQVALLLSTFVSSINASACVASIKTA